MTALETSPERFFVAGSCEVVCCAIIQDWMPFCCSQGSLGRQRVVLAYSAPTAVRAAPASAPTSHFSMPPMRVTIRTLVADPPDSFYTVWSDNTAAKGGICRVVPLLLQDWVQQADIWHWPDCCLFAMSNSIASCKALPARSASCDAASE